jgi:hypothetical protein
MGVFDGILSDQTMSLMSKTEVTGQRRRDNVFDLFCLSVVLL